MINLKLLKNDQNIKNKILQKDSSFNIDLLLVKYDLLIAIKTEIDLILSKINKLSKINNFQNITEERKAESKFLSKELEDKKKNLEIIEKEFNDLYLKCPNIIFEEVPLGGKENNEIIRFFSEKPKFNHDIKNHIDLLVDNKNVSFSTGSKIAKSGFVFYEEKAAWIMYRLCMIFLKINEKNGFKVIIPPQLASEETLIASSNLPKFQEDLFKIQDEELYLIPTSEVSISYLHSNEVLNENFLPLRYTAWTKCFRKEAGGYGANERGLIRIHEFEKVEIFSFTKEEDSKKEHEFMVSCIEEILKKLKLHYRVSLLAAGDCSFQSAKTYDLEVWLPGQNQYREVSSISNCTDFQSRRSKTRYKDSLSNSNKFVHTLNGSSLALPRIMVALFENNQNISGNIDFDIIFDLLSSIEKDLW